MVSSREGALTELRRRFGVDLMTAPVVLAAYAYDATGIVSRPDAVLRPKAPQEVAAAVALCATSGVPLVARGAGTGLSGGAVAIEGGLVLSMEKLRGVLAVDVQRRRAQVRPGQVNEQLQRELAPHGLFFGADPASQRASTIGGNIAENAGGPHAFKYGVTGSQLRRLEVVLADGSLTWLPASGCVQPSCDLNALVAGSEGTLAVVTCAEVDLLPLPEATETMLGTFADEAAALAAVAAMVAAGLVPATLELLDKPQVECVRPFCGDDYPADAGAVLLIEVDGDEKSCRASADEVAQALAPYALEVLRARDEGQRQRLWLGRRASFAGLSRYGRRVLTQDVTVPRPRLPQMIREMHAIAERYGLLVATVAHAGDGNLHPCFPYDPDDAELGERVHRANRDVMKACIALDGSISGEHGIGVDKLEHQDLMFSAAELGLMHAVRLACDPGLILNPGKKVPVVPRLKAPPGSARDDGTDEQGVAAFLESARDEQAGVAVGRVELPFTRQLSLEGFQTLAIDPENLTVTAGAGVTWQRLQRELAAAGLWLPVEAASTQQSVGAMIAENAYGALAHRYGSLRRWLLATRFVTGAGEIVRFGRPIMKNVAGYNLPHLLIGSRGTLAVITEATLRVLRQGAKERLFQITGALTDLERLALSCDAASAAWIEPFEGSFRLVLQGTAAVEGAVPCEAGPDAGPPTLTVVGRTAIEAVLEALPRQRLRLLPRPERLDLWGPVDAEPPWLGGIERLCLDGSAAVFTAGRRLSPLSEPCEQLLRSIRETFDPDGILNPGIRL